MPRTITKATYIGDAVYVHSDGHSIFLTTRGDVQRPHDASLGDERCQRCGLVLSDRNTPGACDVSNRIALEPEVMGALVDWIRGDDSPVKLAW